MYNYELWLKKAFQNIKLVSYCKSVCVYVLPGTQFACAASGFFHLGLTLLAAVTAVVTSFNDAVLSRLG